MTKKDTAKIVRHPYDDKILKIEERIQGWVGSGFKSRTASLEVHAVKNDELDEVRIGIQVVTYYESSNRSQLASITLDRELANKFIEAMNNPVQRKNPSAA